MLQIIEKSISIHRRNDQNTTNLVFFLQNVFNFGSLSKDFLADFSAMWEIGIMHLRSLILEKVTKGTAVNDSEGLCASVRKAKLKNSSKYLVFHSYQLHNMVNQPLLCPHWNWLHKTVEFCLLEACTVTSVLLL